MNIGILHCCCSPRCRARRPNWGAWDSHCRFAVAPSVAGGTGGGVRSSWTRTRSGQCRTTARESVGSTLGSSSVFLIYLRFLVETRIGNYSELFLLTKTTWKEKISWWTNVIVLFTSLLNNCFIYTPLLSALIFGRVQRIIKWLWEAVVLVCQQTKRDNLKDKYLSGFNSIYAWAR